MDGLTYEDVKSDRVLVFADWKLNDINNIKISQNYYHKEGVFTNVEIDNISNLVTLLSPLINEATINANGALVANELYRKSKVLWIPKNEHTLWIYSKLGEIAIEVNKEMGWDFDLTAMTECIQYTEYDSQYQGFYDWHLDIGNNTSSKRKISISIQLSSDKEYEGGDLEFKTGRQIETVSKKENCAILFPSYFLHRVKPVTKGVRKSLVLWISGPKFK